VVALVGVAAVAAAIQFTKANETAAALAFGGALIVACVTWIATDRRQDTALDAEDRRHRAALDAEGKRLQQRLAHERDLDDRQRMREFLDDLATALDDAVRAYTRMHEHFRAARIQRGAHHDEDEEMYGTHRREVAVAVVSLTALARRLELRFPPDHPTVEAFTEAVGALHQGLAPTDPEDFRDPVDRHHDMTRAGGHALTYLKDFTEAVRSVFTERRDLHAA
jgi:hypothetical protein